MKRAFTLVELLVVISIVSMLASIIMVRISLAQATGRDSVRTQQIRQIDLATQLYVETKGKPPLTGCEYQAGNPPPSESEASACIAVSTNGTEIQRNNWETLKDELSEFIDLPEDPCGTCASSSAFPIGYTYVSPYAMQYYCITMGTCTATEYTYQLYAALERQSVPTGNNGLTEDYYIFDPVEELPGSNLPSEPTDFAVTLGSEWSGGLLMETFTWTASVDNGSGIGEYYIYKVGETSYLRKTAATSLIHYLFTNESGADSCYIVRATDATENKQSPPSNLACTGMVAHPLQPAPVISSATYNLQNGTTLVWSAPTSMPTDAIDLHYTVYLNDDPVTTVNHPSTSITLPSDGSSNCWKVKALANFAGAFDVYTSEVSPPVCVTGSH